MVNFDDLSLQPRIEEGRTPAEVVYTGGGNTALLFASRPQAEKFTREWSLHVIREAPGLGITAAHRDFDWENERMEAVWEDLLSNILPARKEGCTFPQPQSGLGVTAQCVYTSAPAVEEWDNSLISAEVLAKLDITDQATQRLKQLFHTEYNLPVDFEDFGHDKGRFSYLAVVHADGNGMGKRIQAFTREAGRKGPREWINGMRAFSTSVNGQGMQAMQAAHRLMENAVSTKDGKNTIVGEETDLSITLYKDFLPFRPIVFGGDDVTFVCNGRLGLSLAAEFLRGFQNGTLADGSPVQACAGVAIVHSHYPFAQAYALAEDLCRAGKKALRKDRSNDLTQQASMINWYFGTTGFLGDWDDIHRREYSVNEGDLDMRPLFIKSPSNHPEEWRSWANFQALVKAFRTDANWKDRRNKVKDLLEALRLGKNATVKFTNLFGRLPLPDGLSVDDSIAKDGWNGKRCVYFDAIEAADFFMPLEEKS
jgi:hypothetical protein